MSNIPQTFFADPVTERLFQSVVALAAEVNVLRDRVARLEAGPDAVPQAKINADSDAFVQHVFGGLVQA